jgi:hypothetical protein
VSRGFSIALALYCYLKDLVDLLSKSYVFSLLGLNTIDSKVHISFSIGFQGSVFLCRRFGTEGVPLTGVCRSLMEHVTSHQ